LVLHHRHRCLITVNFVYQLQLCLWGEHLIAPDCIHCGRLRKHFTQTTGKTAGVKPLQRLNVHRGHNPAGRATAGTGQTDRAAALAAQFLFALQWPPLHEVWVCPSIVFVEVRHSTPKPEMESGETPTHKDIDAIVGNDSIEEFEYRLLQFECFNLHGLHDVLLMR